MWTSYINMQPKTSSIVSLVTRGGCILWTMSSSCHRRKSSTTVESSSMIKRRSLLFTRRLTVFQCVLSSRNTFRTNGLSKRRRDLNVLGSFQDSFFSNDLKIALGPTLTCTLFFFSTAFFINTLFFINFSCDVQVRYAVISILHQVSNTVFILVWFRIRRWTIGWEICLLLASST